MNNKKFKNQILSLALIGVLLVSNSFHASELNTLTNQKQSNEIILEDLVLIREQLQNRVNKLIEMVGDSDPELGFKVYDIFTEYVTENYPELTALEKVGKVKELTQKIQLDFPQVPVVHAEELEDFEELYYNTHEVHMLNTYNYYLNKTKQETVTDYPEKNIPFDEIIAFLLEDKEVKSDTLQYDIQYFMDCSIKFVENPEVISKYIEIYGQEAYDSNILILTEETDNFNMIRSESPFASYYNPYLTSEYAHKWNGANAICKHATSGILKVHDTNSCFNGYNSYYKYYKNEDCANFVSQSIFAGKMAQGPTWGNSNGSSATVAWRNCPKLIEHFWANKGAKKKTFNISDLKKDMTEFNKLAHKGDMFFLVNSDGIPWHAMVISGDDTVQLFYSAHTSNRHRVSIKQMISGLPVDNYNVKLILISFQ